MTKDFNAFDNDKYCRKLIDSTESEDFLKWIEKEANIKKILGELPTQEDGESLAHEFIGLGATDIWAVEIDRATDDFKIESSGKLCIKLPKNETQRSSTIEKINELLLEQGFDEIPDCGQKYAYLPLD